jgi:hypothetical protein
MNRHVALMLTGMTLSGAPPCFAQTDPFIGTWQLNLAKSTFSPGPPLRVHTVTIEEDGPNHKITVVGTNAQGNPTSAVTTRIYDGMPHPVTGNPNFDANAFTRVDAYTDIISRTKAGKLVQTVTDVVSRDGKTATYTIIGTDARGRSINNIQVYDKQ